MKSQSMAETSVTAARPMSGAKRKVNTEPPSGRIISLPRSFRTSAMGWNQGGPLRHWTRAVTLRSTQVESNPTKAVNKKPGTTMK